MKLSTKVVSAALSAVLLVTCLSPAFAAAKKTIEVYSDMTISINGSPLIPRNANGEAVDILEYNGTTYVPIRAIAEAFGAQVGYDESTRTALITRSGGSLDSNMLDAIQLYKYLSDFSANGEMVLGILSDILSRSLTASIEQDEAFEMLNSYSEYLQTLTQQFDAVSAQIDVVVQTAPDAGFDDMHTCVDYLTAGCESVALTLQNLYYYLVTGSDEYLTEYYAQLAEADNMYYSVWSYVNGRFYDLAGQMAA